MKKFKFILIILFILTSTSQAFCTGVTPKSNAYAINIVWTLIAAFLVFFMQAGFAMLESGFSRAKNASNIMMKNLMDFSVGSIAFWAVGFGIMFGLDKYGLFGSSRFFLLSGDPSTIKGLWEFAYWMFQVVFAATAATIVSGAVAERTRFAAYLIYSAFISAVIYPTIGHWIWGGGWLSKLGMIDFAGSTVVHSVGGWSGLVGTLMLGPRIGKYINVNKKKYVKAIPGHNIPLATLGIFILWFGWFGFNTGSTTSGTNLSIAVIAVTTNLSAAAGSLGAMFYSWIRFKKPDPSMALNGALSGLVAITAGCAVVSPISAIAIGSIAGILVVISIQFFDKWLHVDDPVGAVSVHGVCGAFGTLAVGFFAESSYATASGIGNIKGLLFGGGTALLKIQMLGILATFGWVFFTATLLFGLIKVTIGLRVNSDEELRGLDIGEHGMEAYSGFQIFITQ